MKHQRKNTHSLSLNEALGFEWLLKWDTRNFYDAIQLGEHQSNCDVAFVITISIFCI